MLYHQTAPGDSARAIGESLLRWEPGLKLTSGLRLSGSFDARLDSHHQTERAWRADWQDRSLRRPALSVRRLSASWNRGPFTLEAGKQFVRWGKADILNPTDRFAPRDYLAVVDNEFLAVPAVRTTLESGANSFDAVYQIRFTPSRLPLISQRWAPIPAEAAGLQFRDLGAVYPGGGQFGLRWNRTGRLFEHSLSFFEGFNHLPLLEGRAQLFPARVEFRRVYPRMRMYGGDAAATLRWFTVKAEAGWFSSSDPRADEYALYVIQVERQFGEWSLVGGYAGEMLTRRRDTSDFAPDRGLARAFLGRASYTLDATRSLAFETAVRQNGEGLWLRAEYSQLLGRHWRATAGFTLIRGEDGDFLGRYHRNSHALLALRYSF